MHLRILALLTVGGLLFFGLRSTRPLFASDTPNSTRIPVVVELFTSEGCSSCPPADALLRKLEKEQPVPNAEIIVLGEHVDYWNYIGWTDRFSSNEFTERQQKYAELFHLDSSYTPQMVVDGRAELNGADESAARRAIADAAKHEKTEVTVTLQKQGENVFAAYGAEESSSPRDAELTFAVTESNLETQVKAGENDGRVLKHTGVVRWMKVFPVNKLSVGGQTPVKIDPSWKRENITIVAFLREKNSRRIIGATAVKLSDAK